MHAWRRNDAGTEHIDTGTRRVLSATSVLVQYVKEDIVYAGSDPGGYPRRYHHLVGRGRATLYVEEGRSRCAGRDPARGDHTKYTYARGGDRVVLPPGWWWEILPNYTTVRER